MEKKEKPKKNPRMRIVKLMALYLIILAIFTFTKFDNNISYTFGLREYGRYVISTGDYVNVSLDYEGFAIWLPNYFAFYSYSFIGIVIFGFWWYSSKEDENQVTSKTNGKKET